MNAPLHPNIRPGRHVAEVIRALHKARGDLIGAAAFAEARHWGVAAEVLQKAAVSPLDRTSGAGVLAYINDLEAVLAAGSVIGRLQGLGRVPMGTRIAVGQERGTGGFIAQGQPAPVSRLDLSTVGPLVPRRCVALSVLSAEVIENATPGGDAALATAATAGCVEALDRALLDPVFARSESQPGAITRAAARFDCTRTVPAVRNAIRQVLATLTGADQSLQTAAWVCSPGLAAWMATADVDGGPPFPGVTARGGTLAGLPVLVTTAARLQGSPGEDLLVLAEAADVAIAEDVPTLEFAQHASVQLNDAPSAGAQQLVSLWQNGLVGIRCTAMADWALRRPAACAYAVVNG